MLNTYFMSLIINFQFPSFKIILTNTIVCIINDFRIFLILNIDCMLYLIDNWYITDLTRAVEPRSWDPARSMMLCRNDGHWLWFQMAVIGVTICWKAESLSDKKSWRRFRGPVGNAAVVVRSAWLHQNSFPGHGPVSICHRK